MLFFGLVVRCVRFVNFYLILFRMCVVQWFDVLNVFLGVFFMGFGNYQEFKQSCLLLFMGGEIEWQFFILVIGGIYV